MLQYMTAKEAAEKWNISQRRVSTLCMENRIKDVAMLGNMWIIPITAEKPADARMQRNEQNQGIVHPFIKWAGGKKQILDILRDHLPSDMNKITKYAEPFVGGGALLFDLIGKYTFNEIYINDNNAELMNCYNVIKNNCEDLILKLGNIQEEYRKLNDEQQKEYYLEKRRIFNDLSLNDNAKIEKASIFIFLNKTCFNGLYRVNRSGKFNVPCGKYVNPLICDSENLRKISTSLKNVIIHCGDFRDCEEFVDDNTFVYFDPPYRPLNVTSSFTSYTEDMFNDKDQIELAKFYKKLSLKNASLMLSNSDPKNTNIDDNFFDELYKDFNINRITATRMINSNGEKRGSIKELLITNY